jgi:hypothetical protein
MRLYLLYSLAGRVGDGRGSKRLILFFVLFQSLLDGFLLAGILGRDDL